MPADPLQLFEKAKFQHHAASHLLNTTYPVVKDPRLFLGVIGNLVTAADYATQAVLEHLHQQKKIPVYGKTLSSQILMLRSNVAQKYNLETKHILLILELRNLLEQHKKSPVEFQRGERFVICDEEFRYKMVGVKELRSNVEEINNFLAKIKSIITTGGI